MGNIELDGMNAEEIDILIRQLIQHIAEAKNKETLQIKYKTLQHPEDTVEMANIINEIRQLNQQIKLMHCNK